MNAVSLGTESFTEVDQPNSLCYSKSAVTWGHWLVRDAQVVPAGRAQELQVRLAGQDDAPERVNDYETGAGSI